MGKSCNLSLSPRRGESQEKFLRRWARLVKKLRLMEEFRENCAESRRFDSKSTKAKKKREKAERQRRADERRQEKRKNRSAGKR